MCIVQRERIREEPHKGNQRNRYSLAFISPHAHPSQQMSPGFSSVLKNRLKPLSLWCLILKRIHHSQTREDDKESSQFHLQASFTRLIYLETKNKMNTQEVILILRASFDIMISYLQLCNLYKCHQRKTNAFQNHLDSEKQQTWQVNLSLKKINHKPL